MPSSEDIYQAPKAELEEAPEAIKPMALWKRLLATFLVLLYFWLIL